MSDVAIRIDGLGKRYSIRHVQERGQTNLREVISSRLHSLFRGSRQDGGQPGRNGKSTEDIWVLQDINLDIRKGEVVGIIGRNGAGKSTLLKILSRITEPTVGRATISGRVASLLEVGTGFHSELTGRENIFLNGTILGMSRKEIRSKFDDIVAFSGVEKFLDTPVKRYSSGMYVRLAFAVASHLDPDILIVDEVLAVGDMDFQKKCLGRMDEVSRQGRTVLFVSHNLPMISALCSQCVLLDSGRLVAKGPTETVLPLYHGASFTESRQPASHDEPDGRNKRIELSSACVTNRQGEVIDKCSIFDDIRISMTYAISEDVPEAVIPMFHVLDEKGEYVFLSYPHDWSPELGRQAGLYEVSCHVPAHLLNDGSYSVSLQVNTVANGHTLEFFEHHALRFIVMDNIHENPYREHVKYSYQHPGAVRPLLDWTLTRKDTDD
ncbi:MAG: ABC transporter ATP-binding protein [Kiloniellaceae bacterium]